MREGNLRKNDGEAKVAGAESGLGLDLQIRLVLGHPLLGLERLVLGAAKKKKRG